MHEPILQATDPAGVSVSPPPKPFTSQLAGALGQLAVWVERQSIPFWIISLGMIVMLFWAGAYKMTASGAQTITPLVTHSPLVGWQFKLLGPLRGSTMIGSTEWTAATLYVIGYFRPRAGIVAALIGSVMFFTTSTMLITTPGDTIVIHGLHFMNDLGLFLFKDIINLGASTYLITAYGRRAAVRDARTHPL